MVAPSGEGAVRCMANALKNTDISIDYINEYLYYIKYYNLILFNALFLNKFAS